MVVVRRPVEGRGELVVLRPSLRLVRRAATGETFAPGVLVRLDDRRPPLRPAQRSRKIQLALFVVAACVAVLVMSARYLPAR
jgi:hypothetical protein